MYKNKYTNINQIGDKELRELGIGQGFCMAWRYIKAYINEEVWYGEKMHSTITGKDFFDITEDDLVSAEPRIRNLGKAGIQKFLWLQKYLKGEVTSGLDKMEQEGNIKISEKDKKIEKLQSKNEELKSENERLKEEIRHLRARIDFIEKVKGNVIDVLQESLRSLENMGD